MQVVEGATFVEGATSEEKADYKQYALLQQEIWATYW